MLILAHDYETTGVNTATCGVVQAALCFVNLHQDGTFDIVESDVQLLNPGCPIPEGASGVHGIFDHHVAEMPDYETYLAEQFAVVGDTDIEAVLGYNSKSFDDKIARRCGMGDYPAIDLMIATKRFKSMGVMEKANLGASYLALTGNQVQNAHDAMADVQMTLELVKPAMTLAKCGTLAEFIIWMDTPWASHAMLMPFGKHKGEKLCNLKKDYVRWALENMKLDADLMLGLEMVR
jgi:DNA polymerase III epsilon subunit-like protein